MAIKDYYEILGIGKDASDEQIKGAFRKLAFKYHPDHNHEQDAEARFKEVNEAYEVLSDPEKRSAYDRYGQVGGQDLFEHGFQGFGFGGFGDIFDAFFGTSTAARQAPQRGGDLAHDLILSFEEAAFGVEKEVKISRIEHCPVCQGIGSKPGTQPARCPQCNGTGQVRRVQQNIFGRFTNIATCPRCRGEGRIITEPCQQCKGSGRERQQRTIKVTVPPGVDTGNQIRISGAGESGTRGGSAGDLYVRLNVSPHEFFTREHDDIHYHLSVNVAQAALGARVEVPTLRGKESLEIPPGSQSGRVFRLKNKGVSHLNRSGQGDELITLRVAIPEKLTEEQRKLFRALSDSLEAHKKDKN